MYFTYVMGMNDSILQLKKQGFNIEKGGSNFRVSFPEDKAAVWEDFIKVHLEVEYWNEYLTEDRVIFLFHLKDGFKRYEVFDYKSDEVLQLSEKLCKCKFKSIRSMLLENSFYNTIIQ